MTTPERLRDVEECDVLVLGGGPAGLMLATNLSQRLRVAILEKYKFGTTTKFWLTNQERLARHGLEHCVAFRTERATVGTFLGPPAVASGSFAVVAESVLLMELLERCRAKGITLCEGTEALSFVRDGDRLSVHTNHGVARTRLVVDATGGLSQIAATFRLHKLLGFYSIYGAHMHGLDLASTDIVGAYVIRFGDPPPLFEVIPTGPTSAFVIVFVASRRLYPPSALRAAFDDHVRQNPFFRIVSTDQPMSPKFGAIPIGYSGRRAIPGLLSCGEAAMIQSPLLGAAFNEVLDHTGVTATAINNAFEQSPSGIVSVDVRMKLTKRLNDQLQLALARKLTDGNLEDFSALVRYLRRLGPKRSYDLFCTTLSGASFFTALHLATIILPKAPFKAARSELGPSWLKLPWG